VPELLLLTVEGFQVPTMPLSETSGKAGGVSPTQMSGMLNCGITGGLTVTVWETQLVLQPQLLFDAK
jgi:hypothetical protein